MAAIAGDLGRIPGILTILAAIPGILVDLAVASRMGALSPFVRHRIEPPIRMLHGGCHAHPPASVKCPISSVWLRSHTNSASRESSNPPEFAVFNGNRGNAMQDSATKATARAKVERGKELLQAIYESSQAYHAAKDQDRDLARERHLRALNRFNRFVLEGIDCDQP